MRGDETSARPIGLRRGVVQLAEHSGRWAELFDEEAARLRGRIGDLAVDIQHVGSTPVEGLIAKPILDIALALRAHADVPALTECLCEAGYIYRRDSGDDGGHLFVRECEPNVRTIHLHAVLHADPQWGNYLLFRDTLRRDPAARARYAELKRRLAQQYLDDRPAYTTGKETFIRGVLAAPPETV